MVGKNNIDALNRKSANKVNRYGIRRLSVGVASVVVAGLLFMSDATLVQATEAPEGGVPTETVGDQTEETPAEEKLTGAEQPFADVEEKPEATEEAPVEETEAPVEETEEAPKAEEAQELGDVNEGLEISDVENRASVAAPAEETAKPDNETYKAAAKKDRVKYKKGSVGDAKEAVDADNVAKLPEGTKFEWVDQTIFEGVGDKLAEIKVTFPDGTSEIIKAPISISNAYEQDGEIHSGNFYSDEKNAKTTSNPDLNIGFKMDSIESDAARASNELGMEMSALYSGGQTDKGRHKMDAYLELDDRLAKYVDRIEGSREGNDNQYEWERVRN
ncbi:Rib/alpha-like domain-containing protein [Facklamia hominis]